MWCLRMALVLFPVVFGAGSLPIGIAAQQVQRIALGDRARILGPQGSSWRVGTVTSVTADTVWLRDGAAGAQVADPISTASIRAIEKWQDGGSTIRVLGFGSLGLVVGGLAGGVIGYIASGGISKNQGDWSGYGALLGAPLGAIVGAVGGGILGRATGGRWKATHLPNF